MEQQGKKREWVAPELLVLARSHPEEAVLAGCKGAMDGAGGRTYCVVSGFPLVYCTEAAAS